MSARAGYEKYGLVLALLGDGRNEIEFVGDVFRGDERTIRDGVGCLRNASSICCDVHSEVAQYRAYVSRRKPIQHASSRPCGCFTWPFSMT